MGPLMGADRGADKSAQLLHVHLILNCDWLVGGLHYWEWTGLLP